MEEKKEDVSVNKVVDVDSCLFITEDSLFDIVVKYNEDNGKVLVDRIDDSFVTNETTKKIIITIKCPSQGDYDRIIQSVNSSKNNREFDVRDVLQLEFIRLLVLARKWTIGRPLSNENIMKLNPKIVKSMILAVRENIGVEGII